MADWCWIIKGGGAQTKHKATGIIPHLGDIDLVLMPTDIDGLQCGGAQTEDWFSLRAQALYFPHESLWCRSTPTEEKSPELWIKKVCYYSSASTVLLFLMPAHYWWLCLLVCCHVCTLTGSKVGTEEPKIFDQSSKKRESPLEEWLCFLSVLLYLYQSLVIMMRTDQQNSTIESSELGCMHKKGFVFIAYKQLHIKSTNSDHSFAKSSINPRCTCLCTTCVCVCVAVSKLFCKRSCQSVWGKWWDITYGSNAGDSLGRSEASSHYAAVSLSPSIPLSHRSPESVQPSYQQSLGMICCRAKGS